jgi:glycolate oxidase FAD binding subunit
VTLEIGQGSRVEPRPLFDKAQDQLAVDGVKPRLAFSPATAEEAAHILAHANAQRLATSVRGGGTRIGLGNVPRALDLVVSTENLNKVIEYEPADLTITVGAGVRFAELQRVLGERGQFLPLDPTAEPASTIGGVVATNASGPFRLRYGSLRDLVIGTQVANPTGGLARAGGKVVKNVTGYDLNKLYVGSLGTLGLITELTFKVAPKPETEQTLVARFPDATTACAAVYRTLRSPLTPSALELTRDEAGIRLVAHLAGFAKPLARMVADLSKFVAEAGGETPEVREDAEDLWRELRAGPSVSDGGALLKLSVPIGQVAWALDALPPGARVQASAGVGVLRVALDGPDPLPTIRRLRAEASEHLGTLGVERCPTALKENLDVFGDLPDNFEIMRRLKSQLDPSSILNPGRFLGRL